MLKKLGIVSLITANALAMHNLELNINDVDLEAGLRLDMGQFNNAVEPNTTFIGVKYLKADNDHSDYNAEGFGSPNAYMEVNFLMQRKIQDTGMYAGLGVKLNYINNDGSDDFSSIPLSFKFGYIVPSTLPVNVYGEAFYAPKVLSLRKAEGYYEYRLGVDVELIENADVYLGYRDLETKYESGGSYVSYNRSAYIGFRFNF